MRHPENFPSQIPTQPDNVDKLSDIMQELQLLKERITVLEAGVFGSPQTQVVNSPVGHEKALHVAEAADIHDAHITVQRQQGNIAIAIRSPSRASGSRIDTTYLFGNSAPPSMSTPIASPPSSQINSTVFSTPLFPMPIPTASPPSPIPSQTINSSLSWGLMMTPSEVKGVMDIQPQIGEFYVVIKGRRPGVYLSWPEAHELIDGLKSPCYSKKTDKHAALGQYTVAYKKGSCEYRFQ